MILNLYTVYVENVISFFYKSKTRWKSNIWDFFDEIFNFGPFLLKIGYF